MFHQIKAIAKASENLKVEQAHLTGVARNMEMSKQRELHAKLHDNETLLETMTKRVNEIELSVEGLLKAVIQARAAKSLRRKQAMIRRSSRHFLSLFGHKGQKMGLINVERTSEAFMRGSSSDLVKEREEKEVLRKRRRARAQLKTTIDKLQGEVGLLFEEFKVMQNKIVNKRDVGCQVDPSEFKYFIEKRGAKQFKPHRHKKTFFLRKTQKEGKCHICCENYFFVHFK